MMGRVKKCVIGWMVLAKICMAIPTGMSMDILLATFTDRGFSPLSGIYDVRAELINSDETVLAVNTFSAVVTNGTLTVFFDASDIPDARIFYDNLVQLRVAVINTKKKLGASQINTDENNLPEEALFTLSFNASPYVVHARSSDQTMGFSAIDVMSIDTQSGDISIGTTNSVTKVFVDGPIHADYFIGDGSHITNINHGIWQPLNGHAYYTNGFVGIGMAEPEASLHVSGDVRLSKDMSILSTLHATFSGNAKSIKNLDLTAITGTVFPSRLMSGPYSGIDGIGTITTGHWLGTPVSDSSIDDGLTLHHAMITNGSIQSTINVIGTSTIDGQAENLQLSSPAWTLASTANLTHVVVSENSLRPESIHASIIQSSNDRADIIITSNVGIGRPQPSTTLDVNGAIRFRPSIATVQPAVGMIRYNHVFEGYGTSGWTLLSPFGRLSHHLRYPEGHYKSSKIYVNSMGNVGIHTTPTEPLTTLGTVVMLGTLTDPTNAIKQSGFQQSGFQWNADLASLVIGTPSTQLNPTSFIIGNAATAGESSVVAAPSQWNRASDISAIIGSNHSQTDQSNHAILSSYAASINATDAYSFSSSANIIQANSSIIINGDTAQARHLNSIVFGNASSIGTNSFMWNYAGQLDGMPSDHDHSFYIGKNTLVGVQTNSPTDPLTVNGTLKADYFIGDGSNLINMFSLDSIFISVDGTSTHVTPERSKTPYSIYISDEDGFYPTDTINSDSVVDASIQGRDMSESIITSNHIQSNTLINKHFALNSINTRLIQDNSLHSTLFDAITGGPIENHSITNTKLSDNSIHAYHVTDEAIASRHMSINSINSDHILNKTIHLEDFITPFILDHMKLSDASITGRSINPSALHNEHVSTNAIYSNHIAEQAVQGAHIMDDAVTNAQLSMASITTETLKDSPIANNRTLSIPVFIGRHFMADSIQTEKLVTNFTVIPRMISDGAVQSEDLVIAPLPTRVFSTASVTSIDIHDATIASVDIALIATQNIQTNTITSMHLRNKTLKSNDFSADAFTSEKFERINGDDILDRSIHAHHIVTPSIFTQHIQNDRIPWTDFISPPDGYIPGTFFGNLSLEHLDTSIIPVSKIASSSITHADIDASATFNVQDIQAYLSVSKGGTGTGTFIHEGIIFSSATPSTLTQSTQLRWNQSTKHLVIGNKNDEKVPPTGNIAVTTTGNIAVTGALILDQYDDGTYQYISDNGSNSLILSNRTALNAVTSNSGIRVHNLYASTAMSVRSDTSLQALDVSHGLAIGQTYRQLPPPDDGAIIESSLQIGQSNHLYDASTYNIMVNGTVSVQGTPTGSVLQSVGRNASITSRGASDYGVSANGQTAIHIRDVPVALMVGSTTDGSGAEFYASPISGNPAVALSLESGDSTISAKLGVTNGTRSAGVFSATPNTTQPDNYAAYFDGPVNFKQYSSSNATSNFGLSVETAHIENNGIVFNVQHPPSNTIDWSNGNVASISMGEDPKIILFTNPPHHAKLLLFIHYTHDLGGTIDWPHTISWQKNHEPVLTRISQSTDIVYLRYDADKEIYYGSIALNFQ